MAPEGGRLTHCQPFSPLHSRLSILTPLFLVSPVAPSPLCDSGRAQSGPYSCPLCTIDSDRMEGVLDRVTVAKMKHRDEKQVMGKRVYLG